MHDFHPAPTVIVGVDGSPASSDAAAWAAREAAGRDIPLKLVYVIKAESPGAGSGADQLAAAWAALSAAHRAVEATATPFHEKVKVESEVLWGNPLATLIELSRSATMVCVGAIGIEHACHRAGSTAAALAGSADCPVAVIRRPDVGQRAASGYIVAELDASPDNWPDNNAVLGWAMAEAKLRGVPLRTISRGAQSGGADDLSRVQAQLDRRIEHWCQRYPEVAVESVMVPGGIAEYLAGNTDSIQLFVSGTRDRRSLGWAGDASGCSVVTVAGRRL